ncbi:MAG: BREX-1 system phosphatase PglZ type B [Desulfobulbus sp.]|nr:BREX-1 system phosphatase PglZ type B [Desulfobulbus sp.]
MRVMEHLLKAIRSAAVFNPDVQVAPVCILWPDRDRQWEAIIPLLQVEMPELLMLGDHEPGKKTGPAIWLRCVIAGNTDDISLSKDNTPIFYLPGVSRQDLRAVESCPDHLKPLAELQYRGVIWSQINAKDWTILAYLKSDQGGLGLDVAQDNDTKNAMQLALYWLLDEKLELLQGKRLDKDYFNKLLTGGDPVRDLLQWLDQGDSFQASRGENEWKAFIEVCKSQLAFNPTSEGILAGATKLATHEGPWQIVWERFCEAPKRYLNIPDQIRKCRPPSDTLFWHMGTSAFDGWPQWNEDQEKVLHRDLMALGNGPAPECRKKLLEIEKQHGRRRSLVWAELGGAPLACALKHLALLAEITNTNLAAGTVEDLVAGYSHRGWKADDAVLRALAHTETITDFEAITWAIRSVYLPWIEESARHLQKISACDSYPGGGCCSTKSVATMPGDCILFVDGLRFDAAKRLIDLLERDGFNVTEESAWAALPSVTATGKAAVTPVRNLLLGQDSNADFEPAVAATGQSLKGGYHLKKLLTEAGWAILERTDNGNGQGQAWCEFGDIDHEGHDRGWRLAKHLEALLTEIRERIAALIAAGWKRVRVVTDHGWLLLPGGLPKVELPSALADNKWGRCASLKPGASTDEKLFPWYWNPNQHFALADGISCYRNGEEYTHGGLSLQECLTLQITITRETAHQKTAPIEVTDLVWKGLRCTVAVDKNFLGLSLDVRTEAGNAFSSVILSVKQLKANGTASVVVEDETMEGHDATVVLIDASGSLVAQIATVIGGEK